MRERERKRALGVGGDGGGSDGGVHRFWYFKCPTDRVSADGLPR